MPESPAGSAWKRVRASLAAGDDAYAGADVVAARRSLAMLALLNSLLALAFLPMEPPTDAIGETGWILAALFVAAGVAIAWRLGDFRRAVTFNQLLAVTYSGVAGVATLEWLAGGHTIYMSLFLLWLGAGAGIHPPRRAAPILVTVLVAGALPLIYSDWNSRWATEIAATSLLYVAIGTVLMALFATVRSQRVELRSGERSARAEAERAAKRVRDVQQVTDVALAQLPLDDLLRELLARIGRVLELEAAAILLLDDEGEALVLRAVRGLQIDDAAAPVRVAVGRGCAGRVAAEQRTIHVDDIRDTRDLDAVFAGSDVRALLGVPLRVDDRVIGVIEVGSVRNRRFSADDVRVVELAADRLAQAIERTRLNERAHHIAETLQRSLLPSGLPEIRGVSLAARYLPGGPGSEVGGDWYDVIPYVDGRVTLVMGDVVGRGIAAASLMGQLRNALRAFALEHESPDRILHRMNVLLHNLDPGQMATAVVLVFDPADGSACFSVAGHPPPLVLSAEGSVSFLESPPAVPLGTLPYGRYHAYTRSLEPGSTLLLYTDGLVERRGSPLGEGLRRLREVVESSPHEPDAMCEHVLAEILPEGPTGDDVALLVLRPLPVARDRLRLDVHTDPDELAVVRHSLSRWLRTADVDERDAYRVTLACNEACMNAIEHAYAAGDAVFEVDALLANDAVDVTVRDRGSWRAPRVPDRRGGIELMRALMDDVELDPTSEGTTVRLRRAVRRKTQA